MKKKDSKKEKAAKEEGVEKHEMTIKVIKTYLATVLQSKPGGLSQESLDLIKDRIKRLVVSMRDVSYRAALLSNYHVVKLSHQNRPLPDLNQKFFYSCLRTVCGEGKKWTDLEIQNTEKEVNKKQKVMENDVYTSYLEFIDLLPRTEDINTTGFSYITPSIANDMVKNLSNLISSYFKKDLKDGEEIDLTRRIPILFSRLKAIEKILRDAKEIRMLPQTGISLAYAKKMIKELDCYEFLSTKWRKAIPYFLRQIIGSTTLLAQINELYPVQHELIEDDAALNAVFRLIRDYGNRFKAGKYINEKLSARDCVFLYFEIVKIKDLIRKNAYTPTKIDIKRGTRLFSVMPLFSFQQRCVPIPVIAFWWILRDIPGLDRLKQKTFLNNFIEIYWNVFNFKKIGIKSLESLTRKRLTGFFYTDGFSISFQFYQKKGCFLLLIFLTISLADSLSQFGASGKRKRDEETEPEYQEVQDEESDEEPDDEDQEVQGWESEHEQEMEYDQEPEIEGRQLMHAILRNPAIRVTPVASNLPHIPAGLIRTSIVGDGNCMFRAVSCALYDNQNWYKNLRERAVGYIIENPALFLDDIENFNNQSLEDYCAFMSVDRNWGDEIMIYAMALCEDLSITVYCQFNTIEVFNYSPVTENPRRRHIDLFSWPAQHHFECLVGTGLPQSIAGPSRSIAGPSRRAAGPSQSIAGPSRSEAAAVDGKLYRPCLLTATLNIEDLEGIIDFVLDQGQSLEEQLDQLLDQDEYVDPDEEEDTKDWKPAYIKKMRELDKTNEEKLVQQIQNLEYNHRNDVLWGLDPGKTSLITAVNGNGDRDNPHQVRELTAKEFYHQAGHHKMTKRRCVS